MELTQNTVQAQNVVYQSNVRLILLISKYFFLILVNGFLAVYLNKN